MTQGDTPSAADADPDTDTVRTRLASVELGGNNGDTSLRDTATAGVASTSSRCSFEISVGEPQKIGDGLSAYTAFRVLTKVGRDCIINVLCLRLTVDLQRTPPYHDRRMHRSIARLNSRSCGASKSFSGCRSNCRRGTPVLSCRHRLRRAHSVGAG